MDDIIQGVESGFRKETVAPFRSGDTVQVRLRIEEGERRRVQIFEGVVLARRGSGLSETLTVRKRSFGIGVEKVFPVHAPAVEEIRIVRRGRVRRSKLYYLRKKIGKAARIAAALTGLEKSTGAAPAGQAAGEEATEGTAPEAGQEKTSEDSAPAGEAAAAPEAAQEKTSEDSAPAGEAAAAPEAAQEKTSEDSAPAAPQAKEDVPTEEIPSPSKPT